MVGSGWMVGLCVMTVVDCFYRSVIRSMAFVYSYTVLVGRRETAGDLFLW